MGIRPGGSVDHLVMIGDALWTEQGLLKQKGEEKPQKGSSERSEE
jgi:hypothetical protein